MTQQNRIPLEEFTKRLSMIAIDCDMYQQILNDAKKAELYNELLGNVKTFGIERIEYTRMEQGKEHTEQDEKNSKIVDELRSTIITKLKSEIEEETRHINHPKGIYRCVEHNCDYKKRTCELLMEQIQSLLKENEK